MGKDCDVVDVLRHYRHDWLNKLQLIKGNLEIGRVEKVESLIEEVIQQSKNESDLTNMNIQKVAKRLLTFNWERHPYLLSYEILTRKKDWDKVEDFVLKVLDDVVYLLDQYAVFGDSNQLFIIFRDDINKYELELDFHGHLNIIDEGFGKGIHQIKEQYGALIRNLEWDKHGCYLNIMFSN
ncbi:Spo0B domain-containing protein [Evansella sp. AB-P1]|uniref:Spo0B domain-containing protein n=1 Tax=Evansella sp. AB-P1 TaxID=3037653 RepID=UPI00241ECA21|nr:Spo0B domain-containing protein [Evansella sp. AB-P1]MDG5786423.1 Spo0B domain-containing protein [Evansella sp. AB-P1]